MPAPAALGRYPLLLCLALETLLLLPRLDLLPTWGDEFHTLETISKPVERSFSDLAREYHPPGYFLLARAWNALPLPGSDIVRLRALSVLLLLTATVLVWRFWAARLSGRARWWFLALWATSPFLILYGRMARSYMLQLVLALLIVHFAAALIAGPARRRHWFACAAPLAALFYVHYLPAMGLSLAIGGVFIYLAIRRRESRFVLALAAVAFMVTLLYLPWIIHLAETIGMVANDQPYLASGGRVQEHVLRLAYTAVSFAFGETLSAAVVCAAALLAPLVAWLAWRGARNLPPWLPLVAVAAGCAYLGAMNSVAFSFIPARLSFVYPYFLLLIVTGSELRPKAGAVALSGMLLLAPFTLWSYYTGGDFLNKGYVIPYQQVAGFIADGAHPSRTLVLLDCYGLDPQVFGGRLRGHVRLWPLHSAGTIERIKALIAGGSVDTVWLLRACHDASHTRVNDAAERELSRILDARAYMFVPYSTFDRMMMTALGWQARPTHVLEAIRMIRR